ncbi:M48 family metallopeptidase [Brevundimonas balnearis]|uniref:M48 family metallopeptidase n=1 Tax=Brevundimonas balnearis TaxID=1572858 RepID=A0ABV6R3B8_9CAUL
MRFQDGQRLRLEHPARGDRAPLTLRLSVNRRARRISVRIDSRAGEAVVIAPSERTLPQAVAFAQSRGLWIAERLSTRAAGVAIAPGARIPVLGETARLESTGGAGAARFVREAEALVIRAGGDGEAYSRRVVNLLKAEARRRLTDRTDHHLKTLGQGPVRLSIADPKSRWGSCSPHNRSIRYSWRIVLAPPAVLDYLAAHEVAHLVRADHSPAYWKVVEGLIGDHRPHRRWLKDHGATLHAIGAA